MDTIWSFYGRLKTNKQTNELIDRTQPVKSSRGNETQNVVPLPHPLEEGEGREEKRGGGKGRERRRKGTTDVMSGA